MAVALRFADYLVWTVRYQIAFSLIGFPIGWAESAGVAAVSQLVGLLPVQLGPFDFTQTAAEMTKLMGKGEAASRRELMELHGDAVEIDI
jgi:hypothetical protein